MAKFPGWRTMTAAQRHNAKADAIFDRAYELAALKAGWERKDFGAGVVKWWNPSNDDGSRYLDKPSSLRNLCVDHDLLGLTNPTR